MASIDALLETLNSSERVADYRPRFTDLVFEIYQNVPAATIAETLTTTFKRIDKKIVQNLLYGPGLQFLTKANDDFIGLTGAQLADVSQALSAAL